MKTKIALLFSAIRHWAEPCCDQPYQCEEQ